MSIATLRKFSIKWTIKRKIAIAFTTMSGITIMLGFMLMNGAQQAGKLVTRTYDETVITTVYARAASSDFASMRAELAQGLLSANGAKNSSIKAVEALHISFQQDLSTAVETSRSPEIAQIAEALRSSEAEWLELGQGLGAKFTQAAWNEVEEKAHLVDRGIEAMVSKVAEDGFTSREAARARVARDVELAIAGTVVAVTISAFVSLMLWRRISKPLEKVARFADEIAHGKLDGEAPAPGRDEIGDLSRAMVSMRRDIRNMMNDQAILQQQSQARVVEALDGSSEGVVVVQADGTIQIANAKALDFLGLEPEDVPTGVTVGVLIKKVSGKDDDRSGLLVMNTEGPEVTETLLPDGRWIQNSRNRTAEGGLVALYTDVTGIRAQRDALEAANINLDGAMAHMSQGLCVFDADNKLTLANPQFYAIVDLSPEEVGPGTTHARVVALLSEKARRDPDASDPSGTEKTLRQDLARVKRPTSRLLTIGNRIVAVQQAPMGERGWLATFEDVTERTRAEGRISFLATHDALTKLPNRTLFAERVEKALARAQRGRGFAIHCLDLDHFKHVNDTLGHVIGDELLQAVTQRLQTCVREGDTVARLGGDEFAILQADAVDEAECSVLAGRLIEVISAPYSIQGHELVIGLSIGIARAPANGMDHGKLLKSADAALYKSKDEGRGTWRFFEEEMDAKLQARREIEKDLRQAVANEELEVFYQPLLDVRTMEIGSFEALLRWNHPKKGSVSPADFIPIAEETGLIGEIGRWVMRTACRQAAEWAPHIRIAVNVSAVQLRDNGFKDMVVDALAWSQLPANRLEIEITESVFMVHSAKVTRILLSLKALGISFAMDDFGTGYSSLSNLRSFPFGKIKIDRSFVRDLGQKNGAEQIIKTILVLGKTLGMRVTAEGVETRKQLKFLEDENCDDIQGYLVGRPMPARGIPELLSQYNKVDARSAA